MKEKILVVDDDRAICELIKDALEIEGFSVITARGADNAIEKIEQTHPMIVILDLNLPGINGFELTRILKKDNKMKNIPIILMSGNFTDKQSIVTGLSSGADDYLTKPFDIDILIARVKAILRRTSVGGYEEQEEISSKNIKVHLKSKTVYIREKEVKLTPKEFELLVYLMKKNGAALDRNTILQAVWDYSYFGTTRTVDVHVQQLRKKLKDDGKIIQTISKTGYKFSDE